MGHLHHRTLPTLREIVIGLPEFSIEQHDVCRGCMLGKHAKVAWMGHLHHKALPIPREIVIGLLEFIIE
jgi:hypothetical protein